MNLKLENPRDIYKKINYELELVVSSLSSTTSDSELNNAQDDARDKIIDLQINLKDKLEQLESNSEWDTFTIAFYGETGAGKSTLVETLRILLNESTKLEKRVNFQKVKLAYEHNSSLLVKLKDELALLDKDLEQLQQQLNLITTSFKNEQSKLVQEFEIRENTLNIAQQHLENETLQSNKSLSNLNKAIAELQQVIIVKKAQASLWQKIMLLFSKLPEEQEFLNTIKKVPEAEKQRLIYEEKLEEHKKQIVEIRELYNNHNAELIKKYENSNESLGLEIRTVEQAKRTVNQQFESVSKQIEGGLVELDNYSDGEIIGDGRADFTRQTQCYGFNVKQLSFNLLDVPGIEGKEGLVLEEIEKAVQAAHAVFYVTNKAAPPQTGENERKGTLEKIKEHLGAQTEVWSIFNKKITNPKFTFKNRILLTEDEQESLAQMDNKVLEQLGQNYQGSFPLSALPAFVASTDHFFPNSPESKRRDKFLDGFSEQDLLELSRVNAFIEMLKSNLLLNSKNKITKANFNKVKDALDVSTHELAKTETIYKQVSDNIHSNSDSARHQLRSSYEILNSQLRGKCHELIREVVQSARKNMYEIIDGDISNDKFKEALEKQIHDSLKKVQQQMPNVIERVVKEFELSVEEIFTRFSELSEDFLIAAGKIASAKLDVNFKINIKLDNGLNTAALVGAVIATIMAPFTAGTSLWIAGAAAFTAVIGFGKAIWSAFSTDFKKSEQRKSVDTNLRDAENELKTALTECIDKEKKEMSAAVTELDASLQSPVIQMVKTVELLERSNQSLKLLTKKIEHFGKE